MPLPPGPLASSETGGFQGEVNWVGIGCEVEAVDELLGHPRSPWPPGGRAWPTRSSREPRGGSCFGTYAAQMILKGQHEGHKIQ